MTIKEHFNELQAIKERLEKAKTYKIKYKDMDVLLNLVESQTILYVTLLEMQKKEVNDFGGIRLINTMLNEWERIEEETRTRQLN